MIIGAHVSIAGGIDQAIHNAQHLGCESFQVFTKNQNQWREKSYSDEEINGFRKLLSESEYQHVPLAAHDSYLINLCANETAKLEKSRQAFLAEIERCTRLGIAYLIFHPGAHTGKGEAWGLHQIAESLNWSIDKSAGSQVTLLIETTAGQGSNLGYSFAQIREIMSRIVPKNRIGVCVDTCHIFAAGYDLRTEVQYETLIEQLNENFGLEHIRAFHLNDSKKDLGSRIDRHERIGKGYLGEAVFARLINDERFLNIPGYLEIPGDDVAFREDIVRLKNLRNS